MKTLIIKYNNEQITTTHETRSLRSDSITKTLHDTTWHDMAWDFFYILYFYFHVHLESVPD